MPQAIPAVLTSIATAAGASAAGAAAFAAALGSVLNIAIVNFALGSMSFRDGDGNDWHAEGL